ncbi:hypothetical protein BESB_002710 [Besnoitia besnoiti]|uniref:ABC1 atypical kinase-like domain-containing protein n=1 Tax=Besnoitia besnoiti TaxID=94643 RepID=A0A2A9MPV8_BESBE|nr:hypothetical protein BESB_002710 [Besnoitia besnoiti]PFH37930.1 hypothetical protein BESB_002710 [Besnoitia besnoiti]
MQDRGTPWRWKNKKRTSSRAGGEGQIATERGARLCVASGEAGGVFDSFAFLPLAHDPFFRLFLPLLDLSSPSSHRPSVQCFLSPFSQKSEPPVDTASSSPALQASALLPALSKLLACIFPQPALSLRRSPSGFFSVSDLFRTPPANVAGVVVAASCLLAQGLVCAPEAAKPGGGSHMAPDDNTHAEEETQRLAGRLCSLARVERGTNGRVPPRTLSAASPRPCSNAPDSFTDPSKSSLVAALRVSPALPCSLSPISLPFSSCLSAAVVRSFRLSLLACVSAAAGREDGGRSALLSGAQEPRNRGRLAQSTEPEKRGAKSKKGGRRERPRGQDQQTGQQETPVSGRGSPASRLAAVALFLPLASHSYRDKDAEASPERPHAQTPTAPEGLLRDRGAGRREREPRRFTATLPPAPAIHSPRESSLQNHASAQREGPTPNAPHGRTAGRAQTDPDRRGSEGCREDVRREGRTASEREGRREALVPSLKRGDGLGENSGSATNVCSGETCAAVCSRLRRDSDASRADSPSALASPVRRVGPASRGSPSGGCSSPRCSACARPLAFSSRALSAPHRPAVAACQGFAAPAETRFLDSTEERDWRQRAERGAEERWPKSAWPCGLDRIPAEELAALSAEAEDGEETEDREQKLAFLLESGGEHLPADELQLKASLGDEQARGTSAREGAPRECALDRLWWKALLSWKLLQLLCIALPLAACAGATMLALAVLPLVWCGVETLAGPLGAWVPTEETVQASLEHALLQAIGAAANAAGPAYVKCLQWAGTRRDLFPLKLCDFCATFQRQPTDASFMYPYIALLMQRRFGDNWRDELVLDPRPVGSGCIAVVFRGLLRLHVRDEETLWMCVAVKAVKPFTRESMQADLMLIQGLAKFIESIPFLDWLSLSPGVKQFSESMEAQLNLETEARNLLRFRRDFDLPSPVFPASLSSLTSACRPLPKHGAGDSASSSPPSHTSRSFISCSSSLASSSVSKSSSASSASSSFLPPFFLWLASLLPAFSLPSQTVSASLPPAVSFPLPLLPLSDGDVLFMTLEEGLPLDLLLRSAAASREAAPGASGDSPADTRRKRERRRAWSSWVSWRRRREAPQVSGSDAEEATGLPASSQVRELTAAAAGESEGADEPKAATAGEKRRKRRAGGSCVGGSARLEEGGADAERLLERPAQRRIDPSAKGRVEAKTLAKQNAGRPEAPETPAMRCRDDEEERGDDSTAGNGASGGYYRRSLEEELIEAARIAAPQVDKERERIGLAALHAFLQMLFLDNFLHADLHPGNVMLRRGRCLVPAAEDAALRAGASGAAAEASSEQREQLPSAAPFPSGGSSVPIIPLARFVTCSEEDWHHRASSPSLSSPLRGESESPRASWPACEPGERERHARLPISAARYAPQLQLVFLDSGLAASLSVQDRENFLLLLKAIALARGEAAGSSPSSPPAKLRASCESILLPARIMRRLLVERAKRRLADADVEPFIRGVADMVKKYHFQEGDGVRLGAVQLGEIFSKMLDLSRRHRVVLDSQFANVFLAISILEGVGKQLDPHVDILKTALPYTVRAARNLYLSKTRRRQVPMESEEDSRREESRDTL